MIIKLPEIVWIKNLPFELKLTLQNKGDEKNPNFKWRAEYFNYVNILNLFYFSFRRLKLKNNENSSLKELEKDILKQLKEIENEN